MSSQNIHIVVLFLSHDKLTLYEVGSSYEYICVIKSAGCLKHLGAPWPSSEISIFHQSFALPSSVYLQW